MGVKSFFKSFFGEQTEEKIIDRLFFINTGHIIEKQEAKNGLIIKLVITEGESFREINLSQKNPEIVNVQRGLSKVVQDLKI